MAPFGSQPSRDGVKKSSRSSRPARGQWLREEGELERQGEEGTGQQGCVKQVCTSLPPEGVKS